MKYPISDKELLEEALSLSHNIPVFLFAICEEGLHRTEQMQELQCALESQQRVVRTVRFTPEERFLYDTIIDLSLSQKDLPVIFVDVRNIEDTPHTHQALQLLNFNREKIASLNVPLVFWMSMEALKVLMIWAADIWVAKSGIFDCRKRK